MSEENPTCKILSVDVPYLAKTGEGIQIDVRYINEGPTGPTFVRTRDRLGNIWTSIDKPDHETGDGSPGFHTYATMPQEHYVFQLEVGYGTSMNPTEITDSKTLLILNAELPPPQEGETIINLNLVYPIISLTPIIDMNFSPG